MTQPTADLVERLRDGPARDYDIAGRCGAFDALCQEAASALETQQAQIERLERDLYLTRNERDNLSDNVRRLAEVEDARDKLAGALGPFARHLDEMRFDLDHEGNELPDDQTVGWVYVTNGDFRRARSALKEVTGE